MRARTREVNIFNMSLLDILCGALGAFCFMTLVLLPYYKPSPNADDLRQQQVNTDDLLKQLEKLKDAAGNSELAKQLEDLVHKLEAQVKALQGEVNQYASQNEQLTTENGNLKTENQKQTNQLQQRHPFIVTVTSAPPQLLDLYIDDNTTNTESGSSRHNPPFNPELAQHATFWPGDITLAGAGQSFWMVRDASPGASYKIYVKPQAGAKTRIPTSVAGRIDGENSNWWFELPRTTLTPARFWALVGTLNQAGDGKFSFREATQQERDAEWVKLSKGATPPPVSSATPATQKTPAPEISKEEMDRRRQEFLRRHPELQPKPSTAPSAGRSP